jgi:O-antigen/teichoic acid export membrane protein
MLIPRFAIQGAAIATTIAAGTIMLIAAVMVYRKFHMLVTFHSFLRIGLSSFVVYLLAKSLPASMVWLPFFYLFLFVIYFLLLAVLKEFTKDDLQLIQSLLPKWVSKKITV